ncbi:sec-independent protein translocase protein TatA [Pseudoalteromonas undina]|uniref:Sec-independent protein translocase protein TatA n=1 Tax=Pseudoalteromonas undina TaxID=43660 RepID=A0ABP2XT15_9GAMM|nr:twin-arginine translocase TatA/TatE family subunit [Pseudoalteromonas undina]KAF7767369.1 sec-independent protein translocase protein TatA [Pseudoalteromonas undina]
MLGNVGWAQLLIVLVIIILLFGTKKLRGIGGDLGGAVKGFKKAMSDDQNAEKQASEDKTEQIQKSSESTPIDSSTTSKTKDNDKV